jgi:NAD(P)H-nitrite reductase large subunit
VTDALQAKTVTARNVVTGEQHSHPYDALVLSPGAAALKPPLPGVDLPGIFSVKTIPDRCAPPNWYMLHVG